MTGKASTKGGVCTPVAARVETPMLCSPLTSSHILLRMDQRPAAELRTAGLSRALRWLCSPDDAGPEDHVPRGRGALMVPWSVGRPLPPPALRRDTCGTHSRHVRYASGTLSRRIRDTSATGTQRERDETATDSRHIRDGSVP
jgi:hypothetical protein